jgi:hypothetical protein
VDQKRLERLAQLQQLRSSGALTDAEFEVQKQILLSPARIQWPIWTGITLAVAASAGIAIYLNRAEDRPAPAAKPTSSIPIAAPSPTATPMLTAAERLNLAFRAATGHATPFSETIDGEQFRNSPLRIVTLPFGSALLTKREIKDGCHACSGYIGVYYFAAGNEQVVTASYPKAVSGWGWGAAPKDWSLTNRFTVNPAIYASGSYMGQGVVESSATITELAAAGPTTSEVIDTGYSDTGAIVEGDGRRECVTKGAIRNIAKDRSFDVATTGSITRLDRYVKRNGKFVIVQRVDSASPCPW